MSQQTLMGVLPWLLRLHAPLWAVVVTHSALELMRARRALRDLLAAPAGRPARDLVGSR